MFAHGFSGLVQDQVAGALLRPQSPKSLIIRNITDKVPDPRSLLQEHPPLQRQEPGNVSENDPYRPTEWHS